MLDILVQAKRDKRSALKLMRKLLKKHGFAPESWLTDKLPSYGAALRQLGADRRHVTGGRLNNRAENSHLPVRQPGEADAAVQVATIGSTLPLNSPRHLQHLRHPASPDLPSHDAAVAE